MTQQKRCAFSAPFPCLPLTRRRVVYRVDTAVVEFQQWFLQVATRVEFDAKEAEAEEEGGEGFDGVVLPPPLASRQVKSHATMGGGGTFDFTFFATSRLQLCRTLRLSKIRA